MSTKEPIEKVQKLAEQVGKFFDGESTSTCMTTLCLLLAMGMAQLRPDADEKSIQIMTSQITNMLALLRLQEDKNEGKQVH